MQPLAEHKQRPHISVSCSLLSSSAAGEEQLRVVSEALDKVFSTTFGAWQVMQCDQGVSTAQREPHLCDSDSDLQQSKLSSANADHLCPLKAVTYWVGTLRCHVTQTDSLFTLTPSPAISLPPLLPHAATTQKNVDTCKFICMRMPAEVHSTCAASAASERTMQPCMRLTAEQHGCNTLPQCFHDGCYYSPQ